MSALLTKVLSFFEAKFYWESLVFFELLTIDFTVAQVWAWKIM